MGLWGVLGGSKGVILSVFKLVEKVILAEFISQHLYTMGLCSFGSMLSIHTLSNRLSFVDPADTCLFYLGGVKVKLGRF